MENLIIPLLVICLVILLFIIIRIKKGGADSEINGLKSELGILKGQISEGFLSNGSALNNQLSQITSNLNQQLGTFYQQLQSTTGQVGERLDATGRVVNEVRQGLGALGKSAEKIYDIGKDISSLQNILRAPKIRGILGELFLGDLLAQILPNSAFSLQHRFSSGETVDAVVMLHNGLVPIDSKFPLENFVKMISASDENEKESHRKKFVSDVKKHIDSIQMKYIKPNEGTLDFGLMYIPAENVYYETIIQGNPQDELSGISGYAMKKRVIPVSPNTLYAYLQSILLGLKGLQIEKSAREIHDNIRRLQGDFNRFLEDFDLVGKHMNNMKTKYDETAKKAARFNDLILSASDTSSVGSDSP